MKNKISIVVPVYKSGTILRELTKQIVHVMKLHSYTYEIIFVCDKSPDNSWTIIKELCAENKKIKGLLLRRNVGQHNALFAGFSIASSPVVVTMDDDLQHDPNDIPRLVSALEDRVDVVFGEFENREHPYWKRFGSGFADAVASQLLKKPKNLYLSPFRALRIELVKEILKFQGPYVYVDGLILSQTTNYRSIKVKHGPRHSGSSDYGIKKSFKLFRQMVTNTSIIPLQLASVLGLLLASGSFLLGILLVIQKFTLDFMPVGWTSLILTMLFLGGVQLFAIGIIGEYLGKAVLTVYGSQQFVIEESIPHDK